MYKDTYMHHRRAQRGTGVHHGNIDQEKSRAPTHTPHTDAPLHTRIYNACRPLPACCCLHAPFKPYSSVFLSRRNSTSSLHYFLVHPSYESLDVCVNLHVTAARCWHVRKSSARRLSRLILAEVILFLSVYNSFIIIYSKSLLSCNRVLVIL
jgi:hypothetical protein